MEGQGISELSQYWPWFAAGAGALVAFGAYKIHSHKKRDSNSQNSGGIVVANSKETKQREREQEEEETEGLETRNIPQLLKQKVTYDVYNLEAKVEKIHTTQDGYAGILSDENGKIPFYYRNEDSLIDDIAGVLLHESKDNQSKLELIVGVESPFEDETSKILCVKSVKGNIGGLDYEVGVEVY
jgi:hypothetical protein